VKQDDLYIAIGKLGSQAYSMLVMLRDCILAARDYEMLSERDKQYLDELYKHVVEPVDGLGDWESITEDQLKRGTMSNQQALLMTQILVNGLGASVAKDESGGVLDMPGIQDLLALKPRIGHVKLSQFVSGYQSPPKTFDAN